MEHFLPVPMTLSLLYLRIVRIIVYLNFDSWYFKAVIIRLETDNTAQFSSYDFYLYLPTLVEPVKDIAETFSLLLNIRPINPAFSLDVVTTLITPNLNWKPNGYEFY